MKRALVVVSLVALGFALPAAAGERRDPRVAALVGKVEPARLQQTVARLVYEPLTEKPARLYGQDGSHYQRQGLKLSKHFKLWT